MAVKATKACIKHFSCSDSDSHLEDFSGYRTFYWLSLAKCVTLQKSSDMIKSVQCRLIAELSSSANQSVRLRIVSLGK